MVRFLLRLNILLNRVHNNTERLGKYISPYINSTIIDEIQASRRYLTYCMGERFEKDYGRYCQIWGINTPFSSV
jgi:hypothetical protein